MYLLFLNDKLVYLKLAPNVSVHAFAITDQLFDLLRLPCLHFFHLLLVLYNKIRNFALETGNLRLQLLYQLLLILRNRKVLFNLTHHVRYVLVLLIFFFEQRVGLCPQFINLILQVHNSLFVAFA